MGDKTVRLRRVSVQGHPAGVYEGGQGPALLLIHGGWGGASAWSRVWDSLAADHRVVAPELPGLGDLESAPLPNVAAYARWLVELLDALGIEEATVVGNSFGGSVAWSLAGRSPERCGGLVLVDGIPMPRTPPLMRRLGHTNVGKALMQWGTRRFSYNPQMLQRAFVDVSAAPSDMRAMLSDPVHPTATRFAAILTEGDGPPNPRAETLLIWGARDRLMGTRISDAHKLHAKLPGSELHVIPDAGHFPQLEAPATFVEVLRRWCGLHRL